jgi:hypothetical protein
MANWAVTATTIYCDAIDGEVTLIVYRDGSSKCTGYQKYGKPGKGANRSIAARGKQSGKRLRCDGLECYRVIQYRDKSLAEEGVSGGTAGLE